MGKISLPEPPEGFEYILKEKHKSQKEVLQERLKSLKKEFKKYEKPKNDELIELGKMGHPYYDMENEIIIIETKIKEL